MLFGHNRCAGVAGVDSACRRSPTSCLVESRFPIGEEFLTSWADHIGEVFGSRRQPPRHMRTHRVFRLGMKAGCRTTCRLISAPPSRILPDRAPRPAAPAGDDRERDRELSRGPEGGPITEQQHSLTHRRLTMLRVYRPV